MNGFWRLAAAIPETRPGDVAGNVASILKLMREAHAKGAALTVFPELSLTGATCGDLFARGDLIAAAAEGLAKLVKATEKMKGSLFVVGLPLAKGSSLFDSAAVIGEGRIFGYVSKDAGSRLARWFSRPDEPQDAVFTTESGDFSFAVSFGEVPPTAAKAVAVLSAEPAIAGGRLWRVQSSMVDSRRRHCAILSANAPGSESSGDSTFDGAARIFEDGEFIGAGACFEPKAHLAFADADFEAIGYSRRRDPEWDEICGAPLVQIPEPSKPKGKLARTVEAHPFIPSDPGLRETHCEEVFTIQSSALATRLKAINCRKAVIGLSGGLDSALALLVTLEAFRLAGFDKKGIEVLTMPGFGTTRRTKGNAELLAEGLGLSIETVDITESVRAHFKDIGQDENIRDVTYENAQARMRTMVLMDRANQTGGIVIGTGDLSEIALGWCTYNGDHMSMYGVNAGVPKTLIREVVRWYATKAIEPGSDASKALLDILDTPVSPELLPAKADGTIFQETEDRVGPYELHDFFLYHFIARGSGKKTIAALAEEAFKGAYPKAVIAKWLDVFFKRFQTQQFKRNCAPDGPAVLSVSLGSRTGWQMASDAKI